MSTLKTNSPLIRILVESAARTLWVLAWTDWAEEHELRLITPGCELMEIAPATPAGAEALALEFLTALASSNTPQESGEEPEHERGLRRLFIAAVLSDFVAGKLPGADARGYVHMARKAVAGEEHPLGAAGGADLAYVDSFGHYLVMAAVGHGVSWFDDHAEFDISIPYREQPDISEFFEDWNNTHYAIHEREISPEA